MTIFNSPEFTATYFLFTFFAIEAGVAMAWQHWRRSLSLPARRVAVAFGIAGVLRLIFGALTFSQSLIAPLPLELTMDVFSVAVLAWGFSPYFREKRLFANLFLVAITILVLFGLGLATDATRQPGIEFGLMLVFIFATAVLMLSLVLRFAHVQPLVIAAAAILLAGGVLELFLGRGSTATFMRVGDIVAYILFVVAVYQEFIEDLDVRSQTLLNLRDTTVEEMQGLSELFHAAGSITSSLNMPDVLSGAVDAVVQTLKVDQSAIALFADDNHTVLRMAASHSPGRKGQGDAVTFPISEQPALKHALERMRQVDVNKQHQNPQIQFLYAMMGSPNETGPMVVQPLVHNNQTLGALIAGNAQTKRPFRSTELHLLETLGAQIAGAIHNAETYQTLLNKSQKLVFTLRNQEKETTRQTGALEAELKKSRQEINAMAQKLYEQETLARKSQKELTEYQQQVQKLSKQLKLAQLRYEEISAKHTRLSFVAQSRRKQLKRLEAAQDEIAALKTKMQELEMEAAEAGKLSEALAAARRRTQKLVQALKANQQKLQQQASAVPAAISSAEAQTWERLACGVLVSDAQGAINRVNAASARLLNLSGSQLIGQPLEKLIADETWRHAIRQVASADVPLVTTAIKLDDRTVKATISPITDPKNGTVTGNVVILYDATDEVQTQYARDEFIASLAQELRTPMTSIIGYVDLLLGESVGVIGDMQRKFLQRVKANVERMEGLLNDLIGIAAIDSGQLEINPAPINMADVIEDALISAKAQLQEKEIRLDLDLPARMPVVEADQSAIHQVMLNLLNNATKCTPVGGNVGISAVVTNSNLNTSTTLEEEQWLRIAVSDSGGGIAEKDVDRVFDRFYQADTPLIQGLGETGVGLSIVKHIIESHGGEVWFETEMGRGTTFYFALPVTDVVNDPWQEVDVPPLDLNF